MGHRSAHAHTMWWGMSSPSSMISVRSSSNPSILIFFPFAGTFFPRRHRTIPEFGLGAPPHEHYVVGPGPHEERGVKTEFQRVGPRPVHYLPLLGRKIGAPGGVAVEGRRRTSQVPSKRSARRGDQGIILSDGTELAADEPVDESLVVTPGETKRYEERVYLRQGGRVRDELLLQEGPRPRGPTSRTTSSSRLAAPAAPRPVGPREHVHARCAHGASRRDAHDDERGSHAGRGFLLLHTRGARAR